MKKNTLDEQIINNRKVCYQEFYFRDLFSEIVKASILASAVMLPSVGCGISHSTTPVADELTCIDGSWRPTQNITPAAPFDHVSIVAGPSGRVGGASVLDEDGTPCQSATDVPACETQLAELVSNRGTQIEFSDADGAHVIVRGEGLPEFFGSIDTPDEAALLVQQSGFSLFCGSENSSVEQVDGGFLVRATRMTSECEPVETTGFLFMVSSDGTMTELDATVISSSNGCVGRRPEGLVDEKVVGGNEVARFFSEVARLEQSAVTAFRVLAQELEFHDAPNALVESCLRAAEDETRHTQQMKTLAHHFGGVTKAPKIESREVRPLFEVALENAVEGCIRETFGAMVGIHQSMQARNERVRVAMLDVAEDETRHARVSWQIAAWIEPRLSESERAHIERKKVEAIAALRLEMESEPCETLVDVAGLPTSKTALAMIDGLSSSVWA